MQCRWNLGFAKLFNQPSSSGLLMSGLMDRNSAIVRLVGFTVVPALGGGGALLLIPLLVRVAGFDQWTTVAAGQAAGTVGATAVSFGWGITGPVRSSSVAEGHPAASLYIESLRVRTSLLAPTMVVVWSVVALSGAPAHVLPGVAAATSATLLGLSGSWFFVGKGDPWQMLALEAGPRFLGVLASATALVAGLGLWSYLVITFAIEVVIVLTTSWCLSRGRDRRETTLPLKVLIRRDFEITASSVLSLGYTRAAVPIVAAVRFESAGIVAVADRVQQLVRLLLAPVVQALQSWVYAENSLHPTRANRATGLVVLLGALGSGAVVIGGPGLTHVVFGSEGAIDREALLWIAVGLISISLSAGLSVFHLIPSGRIRAVSASTSIASLAAVFGLVVATPIGGSTAAIAVIALAEVGVATSQAVVVLLTSTAVDRKVQV